MISHCWWQIYIRLCSFHFFRHHLTTFTFTHLQDSYHDISRDCVIDFSEAAKRTQQDDGSYKCKICGENFGGDEAFSNLKDHITAKCKHPIEIQCKDCGKPFSNQSDFKKHIDLKHLNKIQNFFCYQYI